MFSRLFSRRAFATAAIGAAATGVRRTVTVIFSCRHRLSKTFDAVTHATQHNGRPLLLRADVLGVDGRSSNLQELGQGWSLCLRVMSPVQAGWPGLRRGRRAGCEVKIVDEGKVLKLDPPPGVTPRHGKQTACGWR